jgi:hypothetical protein
MVNPSINSPMVMLGAIGTLLIIWGIAGFTFMLLLPHGFLIPQWLNFLPWRYMIIPLFIKSNLNLGLIAIGFCFWGVALLVRPKTIREDIDENING